MISYQSTRGSAPALPFTDVLLAGLAPDGGLYCPSEIPSLPDVSTATDYVSFAQRIMWPFVEGTIGLDDFDALVADSYTRFRHDEICPVVELGTDEYLLDLTLGPTLAFKDVALQLVGRLLDFELTRRGQRVTVLGATSGDTGSAAIEALANRSAIDVVILHPEGRVSDVQRKQMTTVTASNVHNVAVAGTFDDCQDLVKAAFGDVAIRDRYRLAAVNSINWARVMAQIVYYVWSARTVAPDGSAVSFSVPTGNFGNILAGWYAKSMGLAVDQLIVASNRNDVLTRYFETGALDAEAVVPSFSPSMDIQVSSNFERLLWEASGRDGQAIQDLIATFRSSGHVEVPSAWNERVFGEFVAGRLSDEGTLNEIERVYSASNVLIDPHTAVGVDVGRSVHAGSNSPLITLATAAPAKFPDAVEKAVGFRPELPDHLADLFERPEKFEKAPNDLAAIADLLSKISG